MTDPDIIRHLSEYEEVEILREERKTYFKAHDELLAQIIQLRSERDEARREVCDLKTFNCDNVITAYRYADLRKWDCYKDRSDD
jgi:autonomous glycyl radical cofactor GrcA